MNTHAQCRQSPSQRWNKRQHKRQQTRREYRMATEGQLLKCWKIIVESTAALHKTMWSTSQSSSAKEDKMPDTYSEEGRINTNANKVQNHQRSGTGNGTEHATVQAPGTPCWKCSPVTGTPMRLHANAVAQECMYMASVHAGQLSHECWQNAVVCCYVRHSPGSPPASRENHEVQSTTASNTNEHEQSTNKISGSVNGFNKPVYWNNNKNQGSS